MTGSQDSDGFQRISPGEPCRLMVGSLHASGRKLYFRRGSSPGRVPKGKVLKQFPKIVHEHSTRASCFRLARASLRYSGGWGMLGGGRPCAPVSSPSRLCGTVSSPMCNGVNGSTNPAAAIRGANQVDSSVSNVSNVSNVLNGWNASEFSNISNRGGQLRREGGQPGPASQGHRFRRPGETVAVERR